jgi:protein-tyrosine phosphatase
MEAMKMIDLHSHILPRLDDGSNSMEESLKMAQLAVESGVREMVATPHCAQGRAREVYSGWLLLREVLEDEGIPLRVYPGMEILGTADTARLLQEGQLFTINGSRYPLVEFLFQATEREITDILESISRAGFLPLIAHPERYECVQQDPGCINAWKKLGCLFQVNRGSLLGRFGSDAQDMAFSLVDRGFATVVASDAHSSKMRTPWLRDVYGFLSEEFSPVAARYLLLRNPKTILRNEDLPSVEPAWF